MNDTAPLAVVTASASGIGLKIAEALIRNGFRVVMSDIDGVRGAAEAARLGAVFRSCDVRDDAQLVALFEGLGTVSALVNNVGIAGPTAPVWELPVAAFREVVEVNLISHFRACQLAVPGMMAARAGAIVNLASVAGKIGFVNRSPYAASKWGVRGLTEDPRQRARPLQHPRQCRHARLGARRAYRARRRRPGRGRRHQPRRGGNSACWRARRSPASSSPKRSPTRWRSCAATGQRPSPAPLSRSAAASSRAAFHGESTAGPHASTSSA